MIGLQATGIIPSLSKVNVLRVMHFQVGPTLHDKSLSCIKGKVLGEDVDVWLESRHFNDLIARELSESSLTSLLIDKCYAHIFLTIEDNN